MPFLFLTRENRGTAMRGKTTYPRLCRQSGAPYRRPPLFLDSTLLVILVELSKVAVYCLFVPVSAYSCPCRLRHLDRHARLRELLPFRTYSLSSTNWHLSNKKMLLVCWRPSKNIRHVLDSERKNNILQTTRGTDCAELQNKYLFSREIKTTRPPALTVATYWGLIEATY